MCTPILDPRCIPEQIVAGAAQDMLKTIAEEIGTFVAELIKLVVTGWLRLPSPAVASSLDSALAGQASGAVMQLRASTWWMVTALAVGSLLVAAGRIAVNRSGREAAETAKNLLHLVVLTGLGVPLVLLLTQIGDAYTDWILNRATGGQFERRVTILFAFSVAPGSPMRSLGFIGMIAIGLMLAVILAVQVMLLFGRAVGLVLLTGLLPVSAAAGMVGRATQTRDRHVAWLIAFVLYKPVAGTVYAAGFWLIGEGTTVMDVMSGLMTFAIALVALPALMRLVTPAVGVLADGAGSGALQGMSAGTMLATGALNVGSTFTAVSATSGGRRQAADHDSGGGAAATGALAAGGATGIAAAAGIAAFTQAADMPKQMTEAVGGLAASGSGALGAQADPAAAYTSGSSSSRLRGAGGGAGWSTTGRADGGEQP